MNGSNSGFVLKCTLINSSFKNAYTSYQNIVFKECVKQDHGKWFVDTNNV